MAAIGTEYRGEAAKPMTGSQSIMAEIREQICRLMSAKDRLEFVRDRLVGNSPRSETGKKVVNEVMQDTLANNLGALRASLADVNGEIEGLLMEIEGFV